MLQFFCIVPYIPGIYIIMSVHSIHTFGKWTKTLQVRMLYMKYGMYVVCFEKHTVNRCKKQSSKLSLYTASSAKHRLRVRFRLAFHWETKLGC